MPPGATGNVATEDLVSMLHEMGYETGIDLGRVVEAARAAQEVLGRPLGSHVLTAGPGRVASPPSALGRGGRGQRAARAS